MTAVSPITMKQNHGIFLVICFDSDRKEHDISFAGTFENKCLFDDAYKTKKVLSDILFSMVIPWGLELPDSSVKSQ